MGSIDFFEKSERFSGANSKWGHQMTPHSTDVTQHVLWMAIALIAVVTIGLFLFSLEPRFWTPGWESGLSR
jgi:hypothetical protein